MKERRKGLIDRRERIPAQVKYEKNRLFINGVEICVLPQMGFWKGMTFKERVRWIIGI